MSTPSQPEILIAVRLQAEVRDRLKAEARAHQRTMSGQVRWLIEQSLPPVGIDADEMAA